jgi:hypothetical protein
MLTNGFKAVSVVTTVNNEIFGLTSFICMIRGSSYLDATNQKHASFYLEIKITFL